ncbi:hypothetical protein [Deinococcus sp.]|uniref:DUF7079 family protein n=1 Tax=Deinococcus sp. TaxID=47478 RepID=UPI00286985B4|nr:hypothetical protein [Deinococcus sp.]
MDDLTRRRAAWEAQSELFLDTEPDLAVIACQLRATGYSVPELDAMLRGEVAPVLGGNLLSVAGVWSGFDLTSVEARYRAGRRSPTLLSRVTCRMIRDDWARVLERLQEA